MVETITYKRYGERAILIEWEAKISKEIIDDIVSFKEKIFRDKKEKIEDIVIGYHSLILIYGEEIISFSSELDSLNEIYKNKIVFVKQKNHTWEIPVCYDKEFGVDLIEMSEKLQLAPEEIIQRHTKEIYTVYFIGFLPGFLYLGGLDRSLEISRKETPRLKVPIGAVAIGGSQTGVYPQESAGGWNIIGRTPISFFDVTKKNPCFAKSGDQILFKSISKEAYLTEDFKPMKLEKGRK